MVQYGANELETEKEKLFLKNKTKLFVFCFLCSIHKRFQDNLCKLKCCKYMVHLSKISI